MKRDLIIILAIIVFISCSPISQEIMKQVDQPLSLKEVLKNADQYKGKMILWGGVIVETINRPEETLIVVTQTALDYEKRPINLDQSEGRFIVKKIGFIDPAIYAKVREITVAGEISGKEELPLGEIKYVYPVVTATQLILWQKLVYPPNYYAPWYWEPWYWEPYPVWWHHDQHHDHHQHQQEHQHK
ncbi:MAG: Slp family lipoprotein [Syntrophaceae bacterium]